MQKKKKQKVRPNTDKYKGLKEEDVKIVITENGKQKTINL